MMNNLILTIIALLSGITIPTILYFRSEVVSALKKLNKKILILLERLDKPTVRNRYSKEEVDENVTFIKISHHERGRFLRFSAINNKLLPNDIILEYLYQALFYNEVFIEFGFNKIVIITAVKGEDHYQFHHNVYINNDTPFNNYYEKVKDIIKNHYEREDASPYQIDVFDGFEVLVWDADHKMNKKIKITSDARIFESRDKKSPFSGLTSYRGYHTIASLKKKADVGKGFAALDVETVTYDKCQVPISVSYANCNINKIFLLKPEGDPSNLTKEEIDGLVLKLWAKVFDFITHTKPITSERETVIFVHNLGGFDGIFIYKALSNLYAPNEVSTIIDSQNKFIVITLEPKGLKIKLTFKDSYRILPVSLQDLCQIFGVGGKASSYNKEYNSLNMLQLLSNCKNSDSNENLLSQFITYSLQDSIALYNALRKAQEEFILKFQVDITTTVSLTSLAFKIFRTIFLNTEIPILKRTQDNFIRKSYFGGATDYYKAYVRNAYYYDVNSLYPYAMCKPMPHKVLAFYKNMEKAGKTLENFFGFSLAEVTCPNTIERPVLPHKCAGKLIYPRGTWTDVYFSEELKAVQQLGYKITLKEGIEFSKANIFNLYVDTLYSQKMKSEGAERWISKQLLNCLYGTFGRKQELLETINVYYEDLANYVTTSIVKNIIPVNDKIATILLLKNIDNTLIKELNNQCSTTLQGQPQKILANVAIASAITSYARIYMIPFKIDPDTVYTDTDSIFTLKPINLELLGPLLGQFKDELNGKFIQEAYFLGVKQYGYWYLDETGARIEKSVFAGVERNSLAFEEIKELFEGKTLIKETQDRFYKSLTGLKIEIKRVNINIKKQTDKLLVNNVYEPISVNQSAHTSTSLALKIKHTVIKYKKFFGVLNKTS